MLPVGALLAVGGAAATGLGLWGGACSQKPANPKLAVEVKVAANRPVLVAPPRRTDRSSALLNGQPLPSEFIEIDFPAAYVFLASTLFSDAQRSQQWSRFYRGRWVRLTGLLRAFSHDGLQFQQIEDSRTYEVALIVPQPELRNLRDVLVLGRFYNFVGRLRRVDETLKVFLLEQGVVLGPDEFGVPSLLGPAPDRTRTNLPVPPPPRPWDSSSLWGPALTMAPPDAAEPASPPAAP
ncbi:MAG: hypothetical protein U1A78_37105 [Polyangia bacterium]